MPDDIEGGELPSNLFVLMKANATWPKRRFKLFLLLF